MWILMGTVSDLGGGFLLYFLQPRFDSCNVAGIEDKT